MRLEMRYWLSLDPLQIIRVIAVLLVSAACVVVAARGWLPWPRSGAFLLAVAATQLAITVHNDYCDRELDARAKPWRALPRGALTPRSALAWAAALSGISLAVVVPLGAIVVAMVGLGLGAGFVYNGWLKRSVWCCIPLWVGLPTLAVCAFAVAGRLESRLWLAYVIGAPLVVAIYLADTLGDVESDRKWGVGGLAQRLGPNRARFACWGALALAQGLAATLWPAGSAPDGFFAASLGLLAGAIVLRARQFHWAMIMLSAATLGVGWLLAVAS